MNPIRVLVVDDSLTVRRRIAEVLSSDGSFEMVGEAADGRQAIDLCNALRPDVVTLDLVLPDISGLAATEQIMAHSPTPILIVSSAANRGDLFTTYEALAAGALDVLEKPTGDEDEGEWERRLIATLKLIARIKVITHPRGLRARRDAKASRPAPAAARQLSRFELIAIGASTGGPAAILQLLQLLPADFPIPILAVLHLGGPFGTRFAEWFDGQTALSVQFARDGDRIVPGVWIAPPDKHLQVEPGLLRLSNSPERHSCRPSVDVLFESVARTYGGAAIGCLLTGMGRDGAAGLLGMRRSGCFTIAQDEASSVVYGMPREAALLGAAERIMPLPEIGPWLANLTRGLAGEVGV